LTGGKARLIKDNPMATTRNLNRIIAGADSAAGASGVSQTHAHAHHVHVVPLPVLFGVFAALILLTVLTVAVTYVDLGALNIWIALLVAAVKAAMVGLYFMHLRYDSPFNGIILTISLLFVAIFIIFALGDVQEYQHYLLPPAGSNLTAP
jgi:cytochrome c oxidase subunit 4